MSIAVTGCAAQNASSIPQGGAHASSAGPALQAPQLMRPMDLYGGPATLTTTMGDAVPVLYGKTLAHFYIGVREIDAIANGQSVVLGSSSTPVQMDLLQYQNGSTEWMTQTTVASQTYSQLRYVLDLASTQAIFTDGSTLPVKFSGGYSKSSSGMGSSTATTADASYANAIDVTINAPIAVSSTTAVAADFNLSESLYNSGNAIVMRPTLSAANSAAKITGYVVNAYGNPVQYATVVAVGSGGQAVNSDMTNADGSFNIHALPADTYQLLIYNAYTNAAGYKVYSSGATSGAQGFYGPSVTVNANGSVATGSIGD